MKKFSILLLLYLLTGCVTYYTPEVVIEDGVYYADEDPAYINNAYVSGYYGYAGAAYYPWWSMDYFYMAYQPYGYGYSPWYYPYYSFYSPWYRPYHHPAYRHRWGSHGDYCQPYNACGRSKPGNRRDGDHQRYAGNNPNNPTDRRNRRGVGEDGNEDPGNRRNGNHADGDETAHLTPPVYRSRRDGGEIRYRSPSKQGRARTGPVEVGSPVGGVTMAVAPAPVHTINRSRQDGGEIRYQSGAKQGKAHTDPVRSTSPSVQSRHKVSSRTPSGSRSSGSISPDSRSQPAPSHSSGRRSSHGNTGRSKRQN